MSLIELLKEEEINAFTLYRNGYANSEDVCGAGGFIDTKELLGEWAKQKKDLYKWLGESLMISKEFEYSKSMDQLTIELNKSMYTPDTKIFRNAYSTLLWENFIDHDTEWRMRELISTESLAMNSYVGDDFTLEFPNGRSYRVTKGCKAIKALGKIAEGFNLPGFEEFRIAHSQTLNQKKLKGELVLSIHPLDYITMSDNDCGWSSCMSWKEYGEYRQGTVEMMNSPIAIVAYLKSSEDMELGYKSGFYWSNKKWRQLFVVDKNVIAGIKEYPYYNKEITATVINWLKELAKVNLGINFLDLQECRYGASTFYLDHLPEEKNNFELIFDTGWMYNDFGCVPDYHYVAFNEVLNPDDIAPKGDYNHMPRLRINYSGKAQCMICGKINPDLYNESSLACGDCEQFYTCDYCGGRYNPDEGSFYINGMEVCSYCYGNNTVHCAICDEIHMDNDDYAVAKVYVIPRLTKEEQKTIHNRIYEDGWWPGKYKEETLYSYIKSYYSTSICREVECMNTLEHDCLIEGAELKKRPYITYADEYYVYFDELSEEGKEVFCLTHIEDNEDYKSRFTNYNFGEI